jgi:DnaJ domain
MADAGAALRVAIDLIQMPSRARMIRQAPLPDGMTLLLRIAAMEPEAASEGATLTGRSEQSVKDAAAFFVEQVMLAPDADSYRVLGASPQASATDLRRNMALLVRWLHPDKKIAGAISPDRASYVGRVTYAWDDLKTPDRRAAYDLTRRDDKKSITKFGQALKKSRRPKGGSETGSSNAPGKSTGNSMGAMPGRPVTLLRPARVSLLRRALRLLFQRGRT